MIKGKTLTFLIIAGIAGGGLFWLMGRKLLPKKGKLQLATVNRATKEKTATAKRNESTLIEQFHAIPFKKTKLENYDKIANLCDVVPVDEIKSIYPQAVKKIYPKVIPGAKWCKIDYADGLTLTIEYQKGVSFISPLARLKNKADARSDKTFPLRNLIIQDRSDHEEAVYLQVSSNGNLISIFFEKPNQIHLTGHLDVLKKVARKIGQAIVVSQN